jgi:hypothetical protein
MPISAVIRQRKPPNDLCVLASSEVVEIRSDAWCGVAV